MEPQDPHSLPLLSMPSASLIATNDAAPTPITNPADPTKKPRKFEVKPAKATSSPAGADGANLASEQQALSAAKTPQTHINTHTNTTTYTQPQAAEADTHAAVKDSIASGSAPAEMRKFEVKSAKATADDNAHANPQTYTHTPLAAKQRAVDGDALSVTNDAISSAEPRKFEAPVAAGVKDQSHAPEPRKFEVKPVKLEGPRYIETTGLIEAQQHTDTTAGVSAKEPSPTSAGEGRKFEVKPAKVVSADTTGQHFDSDNQSFERKQSKDELLETKQPKKRTFTVEKSSTPSSDEAKEPQITNSELPPKSTKSKPDSPTYTQPPINSTPSTSATMSEQLQRIFDMNTEILKRLENLAPLPVQSSNPSPNLIASPGVSLRKTSDPTKDQIHVPASGAGAKDVPTAPVTAAVGGGVPSTSGTYAVPRHPASGSNIGSKDKNLERLRNYLNEMKLELEQATIERSKTESIHLTLKERNSILEKRLEEEKTRRQALESKVKDEQRKIALLRAQLDTLRNSNPVLREILSDVVIFDDPPIASNANIPTPGLQPKHTHTTVETHPPEVTPAPGDISRPNSLPLSLGAESFTSIPSLPPQVPRSQTQAAHTHSTQSQQSSPVLSMPSPTASTPGAFDFFPPTHTHTQTSAPTSMNGFNSQHNPTPSQVSESEDQLAAIAMRAHRSGSGPPLPLLHPQIQTQSNTYTQTKTHTQTPHVEGFGNEEHKRRTTLNPGGTHTHTH